MGQKNPESPKIPPRKNQQTPQRSYRKMEKETSCGTGQKCGFGTTVRNIHFAHDFPDDGLDIDHLFLVGSSCGGEHFARLRFLFSILEVMTFGICEKRAESHGTQLDLGIDQSRQNNRVDSQT